MQLSEEKPPQLSRVESQAIADGFATPIFVARESRITAAPYYTVLFRLFLHHRNHSETPSPSRTGRIYPNSFTPPLPAGLKDKMVHSTPVPSSGFQALILCGPGESLNTISSNPEENPKCLIPIAVCVGESQSRLQ